ncbi:Serine/threonine-protein phosphatase 6 regulatory ankyrin repeat subunit A [Phytophthora cinnamomi]|uniref:Serine/threonine-protein phosphatase 6 regulatory ankyrin repeat subunit A n=1 Tax=Phytophthora cinnamomi TaxID=4785 RepID=UPI003559F3EA|nr:Serine/threonine-protein phosphatase 6 regulatory ankyrin repeat subunit A [Phytophthora cinnamomi]
MKINTFTCIKTGSTFILAIAAIPFAAVTYVLWRLSHSYYEAKRAGKIADGFTLAAKTDNVDEILSGIANKIDIDANGSDGRNALHWACTLHRTSICHVLLKKGASISKKDRDGWTPLHWASRVGNLDSVRLLAKYGANLNVQDRWGTTPLMLTVVGESKIAAETLIELGASVDARNVFGQTPLMLCAEGGTPLHQIGMVFLNAGSNLALQDAQGMTALHYAAANGSVNLLMNMLQQCDSQLFGEALSYLAVLHSQPKILELVRNWREGNPIVASYEDDDDDDDEVATGADSADDDDGSDDDSEQ